MMKKISVTELSRHFRAVLDRLEEGGEPLLIVRNKRPVARLVGGGAPRMTALEALGDIYRTLDDEEGRRWLEDAHCSRETRRISEISPAWSSGS